MGLEHLVDEIRTILGADYVKTDTESLKAWGVDWTKNFDIRPSAVVFPGSTEDVAAVVRACHAAGQPIVPSGGRTGLAGGAVAAQGEIVLSLDRLNQIEEIDTVGMTATVQAGVRTQQLQEAAKDVGLFFALDLAAKGSSQIGGNIASNAGGTKFIRFGGMREQVICLEVVLADGRILPLAKPLRKNNTGYDFNRLFVGSEGTLGIITRATVQLLPAPQKLELFCLALPSFSAIPELLKLCREKGLTISAFEFFTKEAHQIVLQHTGTKSPFTDFHPYYVILEIEMSEDAPSDKLDHVLELMFERELVQDGVLAGSSAQFHELWSLREMITESLAASYQVHKNDISVAVKDLAPFIEELHGLLETQANQGVQLILFGHIGDGNLHLNYIGSKDEDRKTFLNNTHGIERKVFELLKSWGGSISAEHGIGLLKKEDLPYSRAQHEIELMRQIKQVFDPKGILNPGKIFN